jgi:WD40 repeat protein
VSQENSSESAAPTAAAIDIKATHVTREWKYTSPLIACRFDPTGRYVFAAAQDCSIQRWDLVEDKHVALEAHDSWLRGLAFSLDGKKFYSGGYDGRLVYWDADAETPQLQKSIEAHDGWIRWLSVSPDGALIATCGNDRLVKLWSAESGELLEALSGHESDVYSTLFVPDGKSLLSGDLRGVVHQWELSSGKLERSLDAKDLHTYNGGQGAHYGGVRSMSLSNDGKYLACGGLHKATNPFGAVQEPLVLIFDWETGEKLRSYEADGISQGIVWRVVYHPSGNLIGASGGGSGGFILFWHGDNGKEVHKFKLPNTVLDLDVSANQIDVVTAHYDRRLRISRMQSESAAA